MRIILPITTSEGVAHAIIETYPDLLFCYQPTVLPSKLGVRSSLLINPVTRKTSATYLVLLFTFLFAVFTTGCSKETLLTTCVRLGLCDPVPPSPVTVDVLVDTSSAAGSEAAYQRTMWVLVPFVARPNSVIRVWVLRDPWSESSIVAQLTMPEPSRAGTIALKSAQTRFKDAAKPFFEDASHVIYREPAPHHSPILGTLQKIIAAGSPNGGERILVTLTDLLEVSADPTLGKWDFECGTQFPSTEAFLHALDRAGLFAPNTFSGRVIFSNVVLTSTPGMRCPAEYRRSQQVRTLFTAALTRTGAIVQYSTQPLNPAELSANERK